MDPQSRRARKDGCERVEVEYSEPTKNREHQWIPLQCCEEMAVEELDAATRHSACDAGQTGKIVKHATWPWQPKRQPDGCEAER